MNITDAKKEAEIWPLWRQAFRPFFLFGSLFGVITMLLWLCILNGYVTFHPITNPIFWHSHEMIFGFVGAFIVGFLMTAVQNWTGLRATNGTALVLLFLLWLAARILIAVNIGLTKWLVAIIDTGFYVTAAIFMARLVLKAKNTRNFMFVPVLLLLAAFNLLSYVGIITHNTEYFYQGLHAAVLLITLLMIIISGRVLPMFTANGTGTQKQFPLVWLERACISFSVIIVGVFAFGFTNTISKLLLGCLFTLACLCNAFRAFRWRPWITVNVPLVWSLHLAYWFIPLGYGLFALHFFGFSVTISSSIHALTAGAMSGLILAMVSRISLGHTGRMLNIHYSMALAFGLIASAALLRIFIGTVPHISANLGYLIAGALWVSAFTIFLINYSFILLTPRADDKPG